MGGGSWTDDAYKARTSAIKAAGYKSAFTHDADVRVGKAPALNSKMDVKGVKFRESRDSVEHPISNAIAVLFDVTGSMSSIPALMRDKLPKLMGTLMRKNVLEGPQVLFGAIGDATCDSVPLQIGQFESGIQMDEDMSKIYLEGGGGGQTTESYELAMYFMARHTSLDCYEKRGKKGYLFIIGDESPYPQVKSREVEKVLGYKLQADLSTKEIVEELKTKYEVFYVMAAGTSYYKQDWILKPWKELLGENILYMDDPNLVCETIVSTIATMEGEDDVVTDLKLNTRDSSLVSKSLSTIVKGRGLKVNTVGKLSISNLGVDL